MARYKLVKDEDLNITGVVVNDGTHPRLPEGTSIPNAVGNRDWDEYLVWEATHDADAADTVDYMERMRQDRNNLMDVCDWTQLPDVIAQSRLTTANVDSFATYRQALADMPQNNTGVTTKAAYEALSWPSEPTI